MSDINKKWLALFWKETRMTPYYGNNILDTVVSGRTAAYARTHGKYDISHWLAWHLKPVIIWLQFFLAGILELNES